MPPPRATDPRIRPKERGAVFGRRPRSLTNPRRWRGGGSFFQARLVALADVDAGTRPTCIRQVGGLLREGMAGGGLLQAPSCSLEAVPGHARSSPEPGMAVTAERLRIGERAFDRPPAPLADRFASSVEPDGIRLVTCDLPDVIVAERSGPTIDGASARERALADVRRGRSFGSGGRESRHDGVPAERPARLSSARPGPAHPGAHAWVKRRNRTLRGHPGSGWRSRPAGRRPLSRAGHARKEKGRHPCGRRPFSGVGRAISGWRSGPPG